MIKTLIIVLFLLNFSTYSRPLDCTSIGEDLNREKELPKFKEREWIIWNKRSSDVEIARHREEASGVWGYARLRAGIHPLHSHRQEECYYIMQGSGRIQLGNRVFKIEAGEDIYIPGNVEHSISKHPDSEKDLIFEYFFPGVKDFDESVDYHWLSR